MNRLLSVVLAIGCLGAMPVRSSPEDRPEFDRRQLRGISRLNLAGPSTAVGYRMELLYGISAWFGLGVATEYGRYYSEKGGYFDYFAPMFRIELMPLRSEFIKLIWGLEPMNPTYFRRVSDPHWVGAIRLLGGDLRLSWRVADSVDVVASAGASYTWVVPDEICFGDCETWDGQFHGAEFAPFELGLGTAVRF